MQNINYNHFLYFWVYSFTIPYDFMIQISTKGMKNNFILKKEIVLIVKFYAKYVDTNPTCKK